ncbi:MAG: hypothetical protein RLZ56_944 [Bacteroidota bacterium]|jgi:hypothetical protein
MKKKKLDIFNLFYSGAAVVILIGVIAKLLEWPAQDVLITGGLAIEALVFGVSAIKYVEVDEKQEVATEATLAKVAEGLGGLKGTTGGGATDTYINIQSGTAEPFAPAAHGSMHPSQQINSQQASNSANQSTVAIDVKASSSPTNNAAHSLWQLEQMDILSLAKDLFFQPEWDKLNTEEYIQISKLFKRVFDKKLPNKEALPFLLQFPVKLPIPEMSKLSLEKAETISIEEMEMMCKAFGIIKYNGFFDHFVVEQDGDQLMLRPKKANETQVFGGEDDLIIQHIKQFYSKDLIISPNVECVAGMIKLKGTLLLEQLINKLNVQSEPEFISINQILLTQSDDLKKKLFSRVKKLKYNLTTSAGYSYLKTLVQSALSFKDNTTGQTLFNNVIEIQIDDQNTITLDDVVNCYADTIYFGPKNEYSVVLSEIFVNGELNNLNHVNSIIEKLITDNVASKSKLLEVFNLKEQDSKKDVFTKLNYHLNKSNTTPSGAQLAFILLYKQYS